MTYDYLGMGHLVGTTYGQPGVESLLYDSGDAYDAMDRFDRISTSRWVKGSGPGATDLYKVDLSYDRNSNPTDVDDSVQTGFDWQYTYDDLDRLTRAQSGTLSGGSITSETRDQNFTLDHLGNWTHTDYDLNNDNIYTGVGEFDWDFTFNKANEITQWDNQTDQVVPVYDAAGNMTDDKRDYQYVYDAFYRLVTVKNQSGTVKAEYKYNGLGHRISARYDQTAPWYHFAYDERWRIVAMYEDNDTAPTEQFWYQNAGASGFGGSSYIDETVLRDRDTTGNGTLDERLYYCQNWHHDVVALVDTSGSVSERANYNAYGEPIGTFTSVTNRKGYAGYEIDPNLTELYHVRHRVLNSKLGRWTRRDPLGYVDGSTLVAYGIANPSRWVDATGLGCGSGWNDPYVPENPFGFQFGSCCDEHDACYRACRGQKRCDKIFLSCMLLTCLFPDPRPIRPPSVPRHPRDHDPRFPWLPGEAPWIPGQPGNIPASSLSQTDLGPWFDENICAYFALLYYYVVRAVGVDSYCKACPGSPECKPRPPYFPPHFPDDQTLPNLPGRPWIPGQPGNRPADSLAIDV